ncbi:MAG TPA: hypothetical protein VN627_03985, partial [Novosphingobium sp.]|nr:hypothetical protein [Novosphingobium sp.]
MDRRSIARDGAIQTLTPSRSPAGGSVRRPGGPLDCHLRGNIAPSHLSRSLRTPAEMPEMTTKTPAKNVLWIMCDQLRYDYLGCTG